MCCLLPPPIPASSPDRCIRIQEQPLQLIKEYKFIYEDNSSNDLTCDWSESKKATPSTGFLDLPKEIRDMIYQNLFEDLKRKGIKWNLPVAHLHLRADRKYEKQTTTVPFVCTLMRTCRQFHYEFAERLYSSPIHLSVSEYPRAHRLPFHAAYRPLVKKVFVVMFDRMHNQGDFQQNWRKVLNISKSLVDVCPNISVLRVGWDLQWFSAGGEDWWTLFGGVGRARESDVRETKKIIKKWTGRTKIPHQLELIILHGDGSANSPICEAVRDLRSDKPRA
ncbi:hypothetical protein BDV96DRAFT_649609 [Lophiotrema nucula]|uniref:F-box domain-containing protein n=1 Tax=Lophiotrema nucula TaxID=690887 RepID=A0A6A5YZR8_9PLEO|nr:hypothetical protein BDV96DRAFT_649609 [Lophiotrema nucula]